MIHYPTTSIFDSEAQTLVNPVNTEGVMGAGLAKEFKRRWPVMFDYYKDACKDGRLDFPGQFQLWKPCQRMELTCSCGHAGDDHYLPLPFVSTGSCKECHCEAFLQKGSHWVLNFPTKTAWRLPSSLTLIQAGLAAFEGSYGELGITSVAFPALGCGLGGLKWEEQVRPLMERYLGELAIPVDIHLPK